MVFRNDTGHLLRLYILVSRDTTVSTGVPPADTNVFAPFSPTAFFLGEGIIKRVTCDHLVDEEEKYVKLHAINGCAWAQTINASVTIEEA